MPKVKAQEIKVEKKVKVVLLYENLDGSGCGFIPMELSKEKYFDILEMCEKERSPNGIA